MQTLIVTIVFGTLTILFGLVTIMPPLQGLIHNRGWKVKLWHILGFVISVYMLLLEYGIAPKPF